MDRVYAHYLTWEDWKYGQYRATPIDSDAVARCSELLSRPVEFHLAALRVTQEWPVASAVNLSNISINRQAWLGQAACCLLHSAAEHITKSAWHTLTEAEQNEANAVADRVIAEWETEYLRCQKPDLELAF